MSIDPKSMSDAAFARHELSVWREFNQVLLADALSWWVLLLGCLVGLAITIPDLMGLLVPVLLLGGVLLMRPLLICVVSRPLAGQAVTQHELDLLYPLVIGRRVESDQWRALALEGIRRHWPNRGNWYGLLDLVAVMPALGWRGTGRYALVACASLLALVAWAPAPSLLGGVVVATAWGVRRYRRSCTFAQMQTRAIGHIQALHQDGWLLDIDTGVLIGRVASLSSGPAALSLLTSICWVRDICATDDIAALGLFEPNWSPNDPLGFCDSRLLGDDSGVWCANGDSHGADTCDGMAGCEDYEIDDGLDLGADVFFSLESE